MSSFVPSVPNGLEYLERWASQLQSQQRQSRRLTDSKFFFIRARDRGDNLI
jgi:hypothetical protein